MRRNLNKGKGRWLVAILIIAMTSGVSFAANRAQTYIESRKKAYHEETGKIEADLQKQKDDVRERINGEAISGMEQSCRDGRLDIAEQFYAVKTWVEKGGSVSDGELAFWAGKPSKIKEILKEREVDEEKANRKISEINLKYLSQCQELLRKTKDMDNSEFNDIVSYKQQLTLPAGAVSPRDGKKVGGLDCRVYEGVFDDFSDIREGRELVHVFTPSVGILWGMPKEEFGVVWEGFYYAEKDGEYEFVLAADDAARFSMDGRRVAGAWLGRGSSTGKGKVLLTRGWHPVQLEYIQKKGSNVLKLQVRRTDQETVQDIPPSSFSAGRHDSVSSGL